MLSTQLQNDYRELSVEARKKHNDIKEAAEKAILTLRSINDTCKDNAAGQIEELRKNKRELLAPISMSFESRVSKLMQHALALSHKLLSHQALNAQGCESVLTALLSSFAAQSSQYLSDESLTVKLLQTLLVLSSATQFTLSGDYLAQSLNLAFRLLMHSKAPAVHPLAHAAVRQIVSATFEDTWTRLQDTRDQGPDETRVADAARLYKELCHMVNGEKTEWLTNPDHGTRLLGLELIDELLSKHVTLLRSSDTLLALTRDTLTKLLFKLFRVTDDYACLLRVLRIVLLFIVNFHSVLMSQVETLITRMISLISEAVPGTEPQSSGSPAPANECPLWVQSLVLEVLFQLTQRVQVMAELFRASESASSGHVYERMVVAIGRVVQLMYDWSDEDFTARHVITTSAGTAKLKTYLLDRTALSESINSPAVSSPGGAVTAFEVLDSREYLTMLSCCLIQQLVEDIQGLSQSVAESRDEARDEIGVADWSIDLSRNLATRSWMTILASLSLMLSRSRDELMLQQILRAYQNFTVTCGVLRLSTPRDAFVNSLCSQALPLPRKKNVTGANNSTLTKKNLQVMKTVLNIAHRMGTHLDEAWLTVLQTFERFEQGTRRLPGLEGESDWSASDASLQEEISIANSALLSLFTTSHYLSDDALITLLQQLTLLSNKHFHDIGDDASEGVVLSTTLFGLQKMREVLLANTERAVLLWPIFECHVLDLAMHRNKHVRFQAVKMLNGTVQAMMQEAINSAKTRTHAITYKMIRSLYELSVNDHVEVRQRVAESVLSIIQSSGQLLHYDSSHVPLDALTSSLDEEDHVIAAWKLVLKFLDQTVLHLDLDLVPVTFKTLDIVCADFLAQFPAKLLPELIRTIGRYADGSRDDPRGHVDVNTSITAVGLLWKVADFTAKDLPLLSALVDDLVLSTWRELLIELTRHCVHPLSEVRTASLHTLFGILTTHAGLLHRTLRQGPLYAEYLLPLLSHVHETQLKVYRSGASGGSVPASSPSGLMQHHSRNSELKQWNETLMISIQGVTRVYKTCFDTILAHVPNSPLHLIGYLTYFALSRDQVDVQIAILQAFKELIVTCLNLADPSANHVIVDQISSYSWQALAWFIVTMPDLGRGHHKLTLALIEALTDIQHKCQGRPAVVTRVLSLAEQLVVACVTANVDISTVQRHLLDMVAHLGLNLVLYLDHIEHLVTMILNIVSLAIGYHHVPKYHVPAENLDHDLTAQEATWTELRLDLNQDILSRARLTPSRDRWTETTPLTGWQPREEYLQPKYFSIADKLVKVLSKCWCLLAYCAKNSPEGVMPYTPLVPFTAEDWEHIRQLHLEISPEFPSKIIGRLFMDVTAVMGRVAQTRGLPSSGDLWMFAAQLFGHVTLSSMTHVTRHCTQLELTLVVTDLADSIEAYLDNQSSAKNRPVTAEEQEKQMQLVAALTEVCVTCLLPCCQLLADDQTMTSRLVTIVLDTAALFTEHEQFACECYRQLFALLDRRHVTKLERATSQLILSMVITRCREVCRRFVVDERNSGNLPLPKSRVYELVFVLTQLKQLEVDPSLWSTPTTVDSVNNSPRRHIWELYPELCECIVARETEVKQLLKELLLEAYSCLSLRVQM